MSEIQFRIPDQEPELEAAISQFIVDEFKQEATFTKEPVNNDVQKNGLVDIIWQGIVFFTVLESTLQFVDRVKRLERIKKLLEVIKKSGKSVYLKINKDNVIDLSKKSVDETMDLLTKKDDKE